MPASHQELPSAEELQEAQQVLQQLQHVIEQIEAAPSPQQQHLDGDVDLQNEALANSDGKVPKKQVAIFLAYNGHGFSVCTLLTCCIASGNACSQPLISAHK